MKNRVPWFQDLTGKQFSYLTVIEEDASRSGRKLYWRCRCVCGTLISVQGGELKNGTTVSCGCWKKRRLTTHGHLSNGRLPREYISWLNAKARCFNEAHPNFATYGGRGITMAPEWRDNFEEFLRYMGPCPPGHTLDRFPNNDGNYEPDNVRWASRKQQARNFRRNRLISYAGHNLTLAEWAERTGMKVSMISARINKLGWPIEKALSHPVRQTSLAT